MLCLRHRAASRLCSAVSGVVHRLLSTLRLLPLCALAAASAEAQSDIERIAHAGGGYRHWQYTNSHEALDFNRDHFSLFEIDLSWTLDRRLVCLHDWGITAEWIFGQHFAQPASLANFEQLAAANPHVKSCTLDSLLAWLAANPSKRLVTDIKHDNLDGLAQLAEHLGNMTGQRVIAQIYTPEEYTAARALGFTDIIWTLYRYAGDTEAIIENAERFDLYAVTMPRELAENGLAKRLAERGVATYVHTINTGRELARFRALGVDEIYTDWLPAEQR